MRRCRMLLLLLLPVGAGLAGCGPSIRFLRNECRVVTDASERELVTFAASFEANGLKDSQLVYSATLENAEALPLPSVGRQFRDANGSSAASKSLVVATDHWVFENMRVSIPFDQIRVRPSDLPLTAVITVSLPNGAPLAVSRVPVESSRLQRMVRGRHTLPQPDMEVAQQPPASSSSASDKPVRRDAPPPPRRFAEGSEPPPGARPSPRAESTASTARRRPPPTPVEQSRPMDDTAPMASRPPETLPEPPPARTSDAAPRPRRSPPPSESVSEPSKPAPWQLGWDEERQGVAAAAMEGFYRSLRVLRTDENTGAGANRAADAKRKVAGSSEPMQPPPSDAAEPTNAASEEDQPVDEERDESAGSKAPTTDDQ